jgi:hypothetical protein
VDSIEELKAELRVLRDRVADLEHQVLHQPKSRPARNWLVGLLAVSIALALGPKDVTLGDFAYRADGVPLETITAIAGIFAAGKWSIDRYQEDQKNA